jgi:hypothetical protein
VGSITLYKLSKIANVSRLWGKWSMERKITLKELFQFRTIINVFQDDDIEFIALHSAVYTSDNNTWIRTDILWKSFQHQIIYEMIISLQTSRNYFLFDFIFSLCILCLNKIHAKLACVLLFVSWCGSLPWKPPTR